MSAADVRCSVFLLTQNRLLREALTPILDRAADFRVVGSSALTPQGIENALTASPGILLMDSLPLADSRMPLLRDLPRRVSGSKMMLIGMDLDEHQLLQAVRLGVLGFVPREASTSQLLAALRAIARGEAVCPGQLCLALFAHVARQSSALPSFQGRKNLGLTSREQQMLPLISRGLSNKEIARELNLAEQTIRNHVHRVLRKVGTHDRYSAVEICRTQGLAV